MISRDASHYVSNDVLSEPGFSIFGIDLEFLMESTDEDIQISSNNMLLNISGRLIIEINPPGKNNSMGVDLYYKTTEIISSSFSMQNT